MDFWQEILDSLSDAVIVLSPAYDPIAANAAAETIFEASKINRPLIGKLIRRNDWLKRILDSCLQNGQSFDSAESTLTLERRSIAVRAEVSPLIHDHGRPDGAIILFHDLSHQKSAEQAFEAGENIFRLSPAGLAHEVKNPLTGIKGAAELLGSMFPTDARAQQYCGLILDGVNRIASLVEEVLAVSSPQRLKREPVNIHQVLHQALKMAGLSPGLNPGVIIEQDFDPSLPEVSGDAVALERVFLNLIRNASEAMAEVDHPAKPAPETGSDRSAGHAGIQPRGTIRLRTAMETQFRVSSQGRRRQFLRVEVADTGRGMSSGELKQLFTPFFTTKPSGTGLGLVLSQRIVALHGGKLWAERGGSRARGAGHHGAGGGSDPAASGHATPDRAADGAAQDGSSATMDDQRAQPRGMTFLVMLPVGPD